jgi:hypothetical protein
MSTAIDTMSSTPACFDWNPNAWPCQLGVHDFTGWGPMHIASGLSALAWKSVGEKKPLHQGHLHVAPPLVVASASWERNMPRAWHGSIDKGILPGQPITFRFHAYNCSAESDVVRFAKLVQIRPSIAHHGSCLPRGGSSSQEIPSRDKLVPDRAWQLVGRPVTYPPSAWIGTQEPSAYWVLTSRVHHHHSRRIFTPRDRLLCATDSSMTAI